MTGRRRFARALRLLLAPTALVAWGGASEAAPVVMPVHRFTPGTSSPTPTAYGTPQLVYNGGPVIANVKVAVLFWSSSVNYQSQLPPFYQDVTNSAYFDWLTEYDTPSTKIGRGSFLKAAVDTGAPGGSSISDSAIQSEIARLVSAGTLPANDANTLYMVYLPPGVTVTLSDGSRSCQQFCGYHDSFAGAGGTVHYGVIPDLGGACAGGCGMADQYSNTTSASSHEMIEAVTDPETASNPAWYDSQNGEIGDICADQTATLGPDVVQLEWSNMHGNCIATVAGAPPACQPGGTACGASCIDTTSDPANCGGCGKTCSAGQTCSAGICTGGSTCGAGQTSCGGSCVDTATDASNCGRCGNVCGAGTTCSASACVSLCSGGQSFCGGRCVNLGSDNANCGSCGNGCGAGTTCSAGACTATSASCSTGQTSCGGTCTDLGSDPANCGACGNACASGQTCVAAACASSTGPGPGPGGTPLGGTCSTSSDCASGLCTATGAQSICTQTCMPNLASSCPDGFTCSYTGGQDLCLASGSLGNVGGGCSAAPRSGGGPGGESGGLALLLLLLPVAVRLRRRPARA